MLKYIRNEVETETHQEPFLQKKIKWKQWHTGIVSAW